MISKNMKKCLIKRQKERMQNLPKKKRYQKLKKKKKKDDEQKVESPKEGEKQSNKNK